MEAHQLAYPQPDAVLAEERVLPAAARRALDLVIASLVLTLTAPLLVLVAAAIRLDSSGPAIFRQRRLGRGGAPFTMHKLRTMRAGADAAPHREYVRALIAGDGNAVDVGGQRLYKLAVDDRVTRVGRLLRRTSLDELPQLWNVLRGDMSVVGPRPVTNYEQELFPAWYCERFAVKPGITGLWQVSGRNDRTYEEMVRLDIEYVRNRSLRLDLAIVARTFAVLLRRRGVA